jgi:hypothetical protein
MAGTPSSGGGFNILNHQVHEKLTLDNLLIWKAQVLLVVRGARLMEFLEGTKVKPDEFITIGKPDKSKERVPNPAYTTWLTQDAQLLSYLVSTMSKEVLAQVATCDTSVEVWAEVQNMFASQSRSRIMHLRAKLVSSRKGELSTAAYFTKMKGYADEMVTAGKRLEDGDIVSYILTGLDADYNPLVENINSRSEPISLSSLYAQLLSAEAQLEN